MIVEIHKTYSCEIKYSILCFINQIINFDATFWRILSTINKKLVMVALSVTSNILTWLASVPLTLKGFFNKIKMKKNSWFCALIRVHILTVLILCYIGIFRIALKNFLMMNYLMIHNEIKWSYIGFM